LDEPISPLPFLMLAVPIFMTCAYFGKNKILLPLSFFITAFALLFYFAGYVIPLIDKDPLLDIAEEIKEIIKPGDVIGVASSEVSYHRLNIPLNDYMIIRIDKPGNEYSQENKGKSINDFLSMREKRVFCVITKNDYYEFASEELRNRLNIMDKTFIWKKFHKQNKEYFKMLLSYLREGKKELLRGALKEEIYLVSNY